MIVDVTVMDINDNPPVFINKPYSAVMSRSSPRDSKVIKVTAIDRDNGVNGDIYYQLVRGNGEIFRVGQKTGFITLIRNLTLSKKSTSLLLLPMIVGILPFLLKFLSKSKL